MCFDDCARRESRRQVLIGGAAVLATAAYGRTSGAQDAAPKAPSPGDAQAAVTAEEVSFPHADARVPAMLFRPGTAGAPPVLVADGNPGFAPWLVNLSKRIATRGFAVLYVDWMTPRFPPYPDDSAAQDAWRKQAGSAKLWRTGAADFEAGVAWMRERGAASPAVAAAIGFCGGGVVLAHHAAAHAPLRALILFYANARISGSFKNPDDPLPDLVDLARELDVPIQGHYGLHDPTAKPEDARELERRLIAAGHQPEFHYYDDAGHGFMKASEPLAQDLSWGYVEDAAGFAEERMFERLESAPR